MDHWIALLVKLFNFIFSIVSLYGLFSIPAQIIRRIRRKLQGKPVSPMRLIIKQYFKYWLVAFLILTPLVLVTRYLVGVENGLNSGELASTVVLGFIGYTGVSFIHGYVLMKVKKAKWSCPR